MAARRIKPYYEQIATQKARANQLALYRRRQAFGLLLVAAAILLFWLYRGHRDWLFSPGWWRL